MVALLVLAVLLVGVPSMARRRAELGAWQAAGRGEALRDGVEAAPGGAGRGARPVDVGSPEAALALRPVGTGLRRAAPGPRVLVRRSAVPRPRCAPGASSRPVLAGRPLGGATRATAGVVRVSTGGPDAAAPDAAVPDTQADSWADSWADPRPSGPSAPAAGQVVLGEVVPAPRPPAPDDAALDAPAGAAAPVVAASTASAASAALAASAAARAARPTTTRARGGSGAATGARRARPRMARRSALHLLRLSVLLLAGAVVGVLAVLGLLPPVAAAVLPGVLALDLVLLRRRAVRRSAERRAARSARDLGRARGDALAAATVEAAPVEVAAVVAVVPESAGRRADDERPVLVEDGQEPAASRRADGVVEGLLTPLADLRAAAAAEAADGLRGPAAHAADPARAVGTDTVRPASDGSAPPARGGARGRRTA